MARPVCNRATRSSSVYRNHPQQAELTQHFSVAEDHGRRGIAGDLFVIKVAGAASAVLKDLEDLYRVTAKARDWTRSMGVAVAAGSIPETGLPTFELPIDEIEIGMGLHGEPGAPLGPHR